MELLLIDPDEATRNVLFERLAKSFQDAVAVANPTEAAMAMGSAAPALLLVNLHGNLDDQLSLCVSLRRVTDAPIVVLVAYLTAGRWAKLREAGGSYYLLKHVNTEGLAAQLEGLAVREARRSGGKVM